MNRRAFLTALGAVATQQRFGTLSSQEIPAALDLPLITITRFPYIQNLRSDRASILWATVESGLGEIRYSTDGVNYRFVSARSRAFSPAETGQLNSYVQYQADLTGLAPGTDYVYGVSVNGQDIISAGETRFRTAGSGPFSFLVLGDSGWGARTTAQGLVAQKFAQERPNLILHTGDLVYGDTTRSGTFEGYQRNYFNYYASIMSSVPFFPCPGNHDYEVPDASPYLAVHSVPTEGVPPADRGRYYSFDWGNAHLVSVDAQQSLERCINGDGAMLRWLDNDLRSTRQFWRIVYFHYPPFATGINVNDIQCRWVRESIVPILENHGVQVVFNGHEHSYQRNFPIRRSVQVDAGIGTQYFTSGGGGAFLYDVPSKPLIAVAKKEFHYLRAEVQGTRMTVRAIRQDGVELDNCTISPKPVFTDDPKLVPVTLSPGPTAGAYIRIIGRGLAAEENFVCTSTPPTEMGGTVVTVNGIRIQLLYVSPTQIYAQLPFNVDGNVTIRVATPNGFVEKSI